MQPLDELATILRPAGGGVYLVSSGKADQLRMQRQLYGAKDEAEVKEKFRESLSRIASAKGVLLAVPSDVGGGYRRGANLGPQAMRVRLLEELPDWGERARAMGLVDLGDVFVVPQFLHDEMLSEAQLAAARRSIYPGLSEPLPVSPLSIAERAWELILGLNPKVKAFTLGGDHSAALPTVFALSRVRKDLGIVQPDAHTDLLSERMGVKYCFATWSFHANERIGRGGRLTQIGIRASGRDRAHWEKTCGVRQFWAAEVLANPAAALDAVLAHVKSTGVSSVYLSNDIDGTDAAWADATGTPEPGGLDPDWVVELIRRLGREVGLAGGDVMELAPSITPRSDSLDRSVGLSVRYLRETFAAALGSGG